MLDNVVKMYVLQNNADLHPLLAFISVVGALQVLGLWGIFIGPIVASCLFALVQIFNLELKGLANERTVENKPVPETVPIPQTVSETGVQANSTINARNRRPSNVKSRRRR